MHSKLPGTSGKHSRRVRRGHFHSCRDLDRDADRPAELARAARLHSRLIGINNRDLKTLAVDLATTESLAPLAPTGAALVCESGLGTHADLRRAMAAGVHRFLAGEALMRERDVAAATLALLGRDGAQRASA